jgi:PIN domain nuclease of toxin-antitoxin system
VAGLLADAAMSAVNWAEVLQKALSRGVAIGDLRREIETLGVEVIPFDADQAEEAARLWESTRGIGLSLGDRACLSLARSRSQPAVTADRAWASVPLGIPVRVIR